jgi:hypothetical protein
VTILTRRDEGREDVLAEAEALFKEAKRRERRRRVLIGSVVTAVLIASTTLLAVMGSGTKSPLRANRAVPSAGSQGTGAKPVAYYYTETETPAEISAGPLVEGGATVYEYFSETIQTWAAPNGSGRRVTTINPTLQFFNAAGRKAWVAAGEPPIPGPPGALRTVQEFGRGYAFTDNPTIRLFDISQLPTTVGTLTGWIARGNIAAKSLHQTSLKGLGEVSNCSTQVCVTFERAAALLQGPDIGSNAVRRTALFEVMARLPGVETLRRVSDPSGRQGIELRLVQHNPARTWSYTCKTQDGPVTSKGSIHKPASSTIEEVIFDPKTATLLSTSTSYSPAIEPVETPCSAMPTGHVHTSAITPIWTLLLHYGTAGSNSKTPG